MLKVYKKILAYVPDKKYLAYIAILMTIVSVFMSIAAYYFLFRFLEEMIVSQSVLDASFYAQLITGALVGGFLLYIIALLITHILGFRLETNLRKRGIDGLHTASFAFFDVHSSGRTRQLMDDNAAQTHMIVAHLIPDNAGAILTPILALAVGFIVDPRVGIALLIITFVGGFLVVKMNGDQEFMSVYQAALEEMNSETVEYIRGMQVVKIFGAKVDSFKALYKSIKDYSSYALNYSMSCRTPYVCFQWFFLGFLAIVTPFVVLLMDIHQDPGQLAVNLIMTLFLCGVIFTSIMKIMYISMYSYMGVAAIDKLEEIFHEMQKDRLSFGTEDHFTNFSITFDKVSFGYTDTMVLEDLSFTLEANKSYALVGSSGSGKSTVAKLISGFYRLNKGEIRIGDKPLTSYREDAIMQHIAFVFQNSKLFKKSIYENVKMGNPLADDQAIHRALQLACCDRFVEKLPEKEDTIIGSKGVYLSGGEKQRIAIARAILKDADIIIMDEASAAVDPENEHELQKAFANLMKNKTVIMIAHRLSSIRNVDEILVMDHGSIVERGCDRDLMKKEGIYKHIQELYGEANEWRVQYEKAI